MNLKNTPLFWYTKTNYLHFFASLKNGIYLVLMNYAIWFFLAFVSYLLITKDANIFWQLLIATIIGEIIEKSGKKNPIWRRPLYYYNKKVPCGLVESWYNTGSFPSGHTVKATFFFLFILQHGVMNPIFYLFVTIPLLIFRIFVGFHYPVDIIGGVIIGWLIWFFSQSITVPQFLNNLIASIVKFLI